MVRLGRLLQRPGELGEAEHWYRRAVAADSTDGMFRLAGILQDRGQAVDAEKWLRCGQERS